MTFSLVNRAFLRPFFFATTWLVVVGAQAEGVAVSLSQEQDGGSQGRACIYVHQGQALFRVVKADEACQPEIIIENQS
ncbi:hypothetical protein C3374_13770 [Pantoea sp. PSNIH4]|nr:hypothetical protein PSNIH2_13040 [Pantoea sp. PSNIH2]POU49513.1 hypothetical protein C3380_07995 [Pantoea sp. PSNIH5]POU65525.1 hypothetical protein C3374_13770 [Pantoea sp. PSNIH4]POY67398.1 hypothetical protein C3402_12915 [Pantoea sp. PSNIH3]